MNRLSQSFGPRFNSVPGALVPNPQRPGYATFSKPAAPAQGTTKKMCLCALMKNAGNGRPRAR